MKRLLILITLLPLTAFSQIGFMPADTSLNVTVGGTGTNNLIFSWEAKK